MLGNFIGIGGNAAISPFNLPGNGSTLSSDRSGASVFHQTVGAVIEGKVVGSDVGLNSCLVRAGDGSEYVCAVMAPVSSSTFGYSYVNLPRDGVKVLAYVFGHGSRSGYIIGVIPSSNTVRNEQLVDEGKNSCTDPEVGVIKSPAYEAVASDKKYHKKLVSSSNNYVDMIPGEISFVNENDVGIVGDALTMSLRGGPATVQASAADATVRIISMGLQVFTPIESSDTFADNNFVNRERSAMIHMSERLGVNKDVMPFKEKHETDPAAPYFLQNKKERQVSKARRKTFEGHIANIYQDFILRPDPCDVLSMDTDPKDVGVYHKSIDTSGSVSVRTAGGIAIERYDRIPVPFRKYAPWDPSGDKQEEDFETEKFEWTRDAPGYRRVELDEARAWDMKNIYMGYEKGHTKDFYVPEESDVEAPEDDTRMTGSTKDLSMNDKRRAGIYIGDDGSVILRDAWGSEIAMVGGVITLSAASDIHILPGRSAVVLAGDDAIVKAKNSVDITATKHDIRLKSEVNMEIVSGSDTGEDPLRGGILIESKAQDMGAPIQGTGEASGGPGIFLKSKNSFVALGAKRTHIHSEEYSTYFAKDTIMMGAEKNILIDAEELVECGVHTSAMLLTESFAGLCTVGSALLGGEGGCAVINADKTPGLWVDIDPVDFSFIDEIVDTVADETTYEPYDTASTEESKFTFRESKEYGTGYPIEIGSQSFAFYQPYWIISKNEGSKLLSNVQLDTWEENEIDGRTPWPGKELKDDSYIKVIPKNIADMVTVGRESLVNKATLEKANFLDSYQVAKV